ncbi:MAG: hypothetical protein HYY14_01855 [Candidatus Omnitrophica bacterium]|nr:hypothetical protein [Candidatus Omnitrophota bacterium]
MNPLPSFFRHNVLLKGISLALAIVVWAYIVGEQTQETEVTVPLQIKLPEDRTLVSQTHDALFVAIRGSRSAIDRADARPVTCVYSIGKEAPVGQYVFEITRDHFRTPPGVWIVSVKPSVVTVELDRLITKRLPVKARLYGKPAEGYQVPGDKVRVNPDAVLVTGPEGVLNKLEHVLTQDVSVVGQTRPFFRQVELEPIPGEKKREEEVLVDVTVPVEPVVLRETLKEIPVRVLASGRSALLAQADPEKVDLVVSGSEKAIQDLRANGLLAYVEVVGLQKGRYELPLKLVLPPEVTLISNLPVITVTRGQDLAAPPPAPPPAGPVSPDIKLGE